MRNEGLGIRNREEQRAKEESPVLTLLLVICYLLFAVLFSSCDYGKLGGADQTGTYYPGETVFEERLGFLCGVWYSHYAGIGRLDGYRIRRWRDLTAADKTKAQALFLLLDINSPKTYSGKNVPQGSDYILLYDSSVYGQQDGDEATVSGGGGGGFMGLVRAINIFNDDIKRGAIIIEYFEGAWPRWLTEKQGLSEGEKPFFGVYYRVLSPNIVQMANAVDLAELALEHHYYTEKGTLDEAIKVNGVENEAEFISWGVVIPQDREK
jgi:hypothetical protein